MDAFLIAPIGLWLQSIPSAELAPLAVRAIISVLCGVGLYRALGSPGEGWGHERTAIRRRAGFALLGILVCFQLSARWRVDNSGSGSKSGEGFQKLAAGVYGFRFKLSHIGASMPTTMEPPLGQLKEAAEDLPESVTALRTYGIALAEAGRWIEALEQLTRATERLKERSPARAQEEQVVWERLFGNEVPTRPHVDAARGEIRRMGLGWLGDVAVLAAYRRAGAAPEAAALKDELATRANAHLYRAVTAGIGVIMLLPQLGLIIGIVGLVLFATGVLRITDSPWLAVTPALWEGFILYMALGDLPLVLFTWLPRPSPETSPGYFAGILLTRDAIQLLAVPYLVWRLKGYGATLSEVGLVIPGAAREAGVGVLAAAVIIPGAYITSLVTMLVSDRLFPDLAPPYHPLQGMTAGSNSIVIRFALFVMACVGAPLLEEFFFRGLLHGALRRRFGRWLGVLASAAFFSALHPQLPLGFIPIAFLGASFCLLYEWRRSLIPGMVAHALNNGIAFYMLDALFPSGG